MIKNSFNDLHLIVTGTGTGGSSARYRKTRGEGIERGVGGGWGVDRLHWRVQVVRPRSVAGGR